jgi:hypothetical protein
MSEVVPPSEDSTSTEDAEKAWAEEYRARANRGRTISGASRHLFEHAELDIKRLPALSEFQVRRLADEGATGSTFGHLGRRYESAALLLEGARRRFADRVVAYPVPALQGELLTFEGHAAVERGIRELLESKTPGIDWWVPAHWEAPLLKYQFIHGSLAAPPHPVTGQAMSLEVYGRVIRTGGVTLDSPDGKAWQEAWRVHYHGAGPEDGPLDLAGDTSVRIEVATYANLRFPGVGVPFYM